MPVPVKVKVEDTPPWRATRHRKLELKEELEDNKSSGVEQPPAKKKKGLPQPSSALKSVKDRLIEDLVATQDEERTAAQQKQQLLEELAAKAQKEKEAAEKKQKMLQELAELERLEREAEERKRQMEEERKRAKVRAEEVAAKVRERQLAEKRERQKRAAEAVPELTAIEDEFDKIMLGDFFEEKEEEKDDSADWEQQVVRDAAVRWLAAESEEQPWSQPLNVAPEPDDTWIDVESSHAPPHAWWTVADQQKSGAAYNFTTQTWSQTSTVNTSSDAAWIDDWAGQVARPSQSPMRPTQRQGQEWAGYRNHWEEPARWPHDKEEGMPWSPPEHGLPSSVSSASSARPAGEKGSMVPIATVPKAPPPSVGPRLVRPPVFTKTSFMEERHDDADGHAELAQAPPQIVAPRVVRPPALANTSFIEEEDEDPPQTVAPRVVRPQALANTSFIEKEDEDGHGDVESVEVPPETVGPRVVQPRALVWKSSVMDGRDEDEHGDAGLAQAPRVVAPRVVAPRVAGAPAFRPNLVRNHAPIELDEAIIQWQPPASSEKGDMSSWRVVPSEASIRDSMDLVSSKALGLKKKGECIRGRREGDWLVLTEEEGYIMIKRGIVNILEEIPNASDWKADAGAWGTAEGNVVVAGVKYSGFVKQFGAAASFAFITSPEIVEAFGKDVFVTQRELETLTPGQKVTFRVEIHKGRPQAFDIERLDSKERGPDLKWKKTKLCDNWMSTGFCHCGDRCQYAHGEDDLGNDRPEMSGKQMKKWLSRQKKKLMDMP